MCFVCERCRDVQCEDLYIFGMGWHLIPNIGLVLVDGEPDHDRVKSWSYQFITPRGEWWNYRIRTPQCVELYPNEVIGKRFSSSGFRSLCHRCYIWLLVTRSVPSLVNLCVAEMYRNYLENLDLPDRRTGFGTISDFRKSLLRSAPFVKRVSPALSAAITSIVARIEHSMSRFDKFVGGGYDYSDNGQQYSIPLPVLCTGATGLPHHFTIYPSFFLRWKEWSRVSMPGWGVTARREEARFQCVHCRGKEDIYFPVIDYSRTLNGYVKYDPEDFTINS